jgi:hypothetical protein
MLLRFFLMLGWLVVALLLPAGARRNRRVEVRLTER